MLEIKGVDKLLGVIKDVGEIPTKISIFSAVTKPHHGVWIMKEDNVIKAQGYGIKNLVQYHVDNSKDIKPDSESRFIGLSVGQHNTLVFGVEFEKEQDMIKMKTSLKTTIGERQVCGEGCNETHEHKQEDAHCEEKLCGEDSGESSSMGRTGSDSVGDAETETPEESVEISSETATEAKVEPDFEYAASLVNTGNKSAQKIALEAYAREFNIELSRGVKFETMLETFKKEFENV